MVKLNEVLRKKCLICDEVFTIKDLTSDLCSGSTEPLCPYGRFTESGIKFFHKGSLFHYSCYYRKKKGNL